MWTPPYKKAADLPPTEVVLEADLTPGDCLYLPRGFTHSARAQVDPSLHISLVINDGSIVRALSGELGSSGEAVPGLDVHLPVGFERNDVPSPSATAWQVVDGLRFDGQAVLDNAKERFGWAAGPSRTLTSLVNSSAATVDTGGRRIVVRTQLCDGRMFTDRCTQVSLLRLRPAGRSADRRPPVVLADIVAPAKVGRRLVVVRRLLQVCGEAGRFEMSITDEDTTGPLVHRVAGGRLWTWYGSDEGRRRRCCAAACRPQAFLADHGSRPSAGPRRRASGICSISRASMSCCRIASRHPDTDALRQEFLQPQMLISRGFHFVDTDPIDPADLPPSNEGATS